MRLCARKNDSGYTNQSIGPLNPFCSQIRCVTMARFALGELGSRELRGLGTSFRGAPCLRTFSLQTSHPMVDSTGMPPVPKPPSDTPVPTPIGGVISFGEFRLASSPKTRARVWRYKAPGRALAFCSARRTREPRLANKRVRDTANLSARR